MKDTVNKLYPKRLPISARVHRAIKTSAKKDGVKIYEKADDILVVSLNSTLPKGKRIAGRSLRRTE